MALAAGAKIGTGYISIEPDFSGFQEKVGRKLAETLAPAARKAGQNLSKELGGGIDRGGGLTRALAPLRRRLDRFGDETGKAIAAKVGKGATKAKGDMFGLADAVGEVEKRFHKAATSSRILQNDMFGIARAAKDSGKSLLSARSQLKSWHADASKVDNGIRSLGSRLKNFGYEFGSLAKGIRTSSGGFSGFDGIMARVNRGFSFFGNILRSFKWPGLVAGVGLFAQSLSALASAAVAVASALAPLAGALAALPAAALAGAQAFGVLQLATAGIGGTIKAALSAQMQGGQQATQVLRQQEDAAQRVSDAERNLSDVQRSAKFAQEDLTKAREDARRALQDMRLESQAAGDSEKEGILQLRKARQELAKALRDPNASGLDVQFAEEAVTSAQHDLERTRVDAKRAREDYSTAQRKGIEKMPEVVAAKRAEADANRSVAEAERDLQQAVKDSTAAMEQQGSAATAFQQQMAQLPPAAQKFVRVLLALKPRLDELRATAASGFFPGVEAGLQSVEKRFGLVKGLVGETAKALGGLAAKAGRKLASAPWGKDLSRVGKLNTRIIKRIGDAGLNLADAFRHILVSAEPFLDWLSTSVKQFTGWVKTEAAAARESGRLSEFFDRTRTAMELLGPILKGVGGALLNIGEAARPLGNEILKSLGGAAEGWRKWTDSAKGQNRLKRYFTETKPAIFEMGRLVRDAGKAFFELGKQQGVATLLRLIRTQLIPALRDGAGAITGMASGFIRQFAHLRKEGVPTFDAFVQVLAEHAGRAGFTIAKALVKGFLNSSILGKLAIAGWLFSRFGGLGAFAKMGGKAGASFGRSMVERVVAWFAGTEAGTSLYVWLHDAVGPGGRLGKAARVSGFDLGKVFGRAMEIGAIAGLVLAAPTIRDAIDKYITNPLNDALENVFGGKVASIIKKGQELIDPANLGPVPTALGLNVKGFVKGKIEGLEHLVVPEPKTDKAEKKLRDFGDSVGRAGERAKKALRGQMDLLPGIAERSSKGVYRQTVPRLESMAAEGGRKGHIFAESLGHTFGSLAARAKDAFSNIEGNLRGALKGLDIGKPPRFNLKSLVQSLPELAPVGRQSGGPVPAFATGGLASIVPGHSTGDRHTLALNGVPVAKVESREGIFVGNRNLMGALQQANDAVPRLQGGGLIGLRGLAHGGLAEPRMDGSGPLRELGQRAIHEVFKGAKAFLDKHRSKGAVPNAGSLSQFNHIFPSHTLADTAGRARFSEGLTARIARWAGLPGKLFGQIAHGESNFYPGIYGIDPGGTVGRGLWQITSGVGNDAMISSLGGPQAMLNPLVNATAAKKIFSQAGIGAWYGTKYVTGMRRGGLLRGFARGGKVGNPFNPKLMRGGPSSAPADHPGETGFLPKTIGRIKNKAKEIAAAFTGYIWGGGHGEGTHVTANGLDCSGSIAKLMQESGWTDFAVGVSSEYMHRLHSGVGDLFTIWSNPEHTFAEIEGRMWGTNTSNGLGYHSHTTAGFTPVHPDLAPEAIAGTGAGGRTTRKPLPSKAPYKANGGNTAAGGTIAPASGEVPTAPLNFGPLPTTLEGVRKELELRRRELWKYQQAARTAKSEGHARLASALQANIGKLRQRIRELRTQQLKLIVQARVGRKGKLPNVEAAVDAAKRTYEMLSERAEQVMALEPEEAGQAAEYIKRQEMPIWSQVFGALGSWRNSILGGEGSAVSRLANLQDRIDKIKALRKDHPEAWEKYKFKIPLLEKAMAQVRTLFNPGPPPSGSLEESLTEVQGPGHTRERLSPLPSEPQPGTFGGIVWDTQLQLRELGIKLRQALESGSEGGGDTESLELQKLLTEQANQRTAISETAFKVFRDFEKKYPIRDLPPFGGVFHSGGTVAGPSNQEYLALLRGQETVFTPDQTKALGAGLGGGGGTVAIDQLIIHPDGTVTAKTGDREIVATVRKVLREDPVLRLR